MKKLSTILTAAIFTMLSATAFACPKGTIATGGTGPNHKGGTCIPTKEAQKHASRHHATDKTQAAKEHANMMKSAEKDMHKAKTEMHKSDMEMNKAKTDMNNKANTEMNKPKP